MKSIVFYLLLVIPVFTFSQWGGGEKYPQLKPHKESLENLKKLRFGIFMHWGPSVMRGTSGWARGNHPYDFAPRIPINEYDSLYLQFNPVLFHAEDWVSTIKGSGAKYYVITAKHHDGFCIWDSEYSDYDMMSTPYKRDIMKELSEECYKQGILFGTYYSICDWSHPEYPGRYGGDPRPVENSDMEKYMTFMKNQLNELIEKYKTNILWFDGYWEGPWTHERGMELYKYLRDEKDDLLVNNRVDRKRASKDGKTNPEKYAGDYMTPEQEVGEFEIDYLWESCITISDGWYYKPHGRLKSLTELIEILVQTVGGGGNLLLNVGPMADGRIEMFQQKRLLEIGKWLENNGESIYGTEGGPFMPNEYTSSTRKGNKIYIHVLDWPEDTLIIPHIDQKITKSYILNGEEFNIQYNDEELLIAIPEKHRKTLNTILVFETDEIVKNIGVKPPVTFKDLKTITISEEPNKKYKADGAKTLIDKIQGTKNIYENWIGYEGSSIEATIDLQNIKTINKIKIGFYQSQDKWIFLPEEVEILISNDNVIFTQAGIKSFEVKKSNDNKREEIEFNLKNLTTRYIKVKVKSIEKCPEWHKGAGGKAWMFIDEIIIR